MKKNTLLAFTCAIVALPCLASASTLLSDDFNSYTDGDLVGQGGWQQTSTASSNPIQVLSGDVVLGTAGGQDVYDPFSDGAVTLNAGDVFTTTIVLSITSATATGDYFFHLSNPAGTTSSFYERLYAKSSGDGFLIGLLDTSGTGSTITYGTDELSFSTIYTIVIDWNVVDGANNDTFSLSVDGTSYLTHTWTSTTVSEPTALAAANFRQGSSSASAGVTVQSVQVDYTPVPEPGTVALMGVGLGALLISMRRRRV